MYGRRTGINGAYSMILTLSDRQLFNAMLLTRPSNVNSETAKSAALELYNIFRDEAAKRYMKAKLSKIKPYDFSGAADPSDKSLG